MTSAALCYSVHKVEMGDNHKKPGAKGDSSLQWLDVVTAVGHSSSSLP